MDATSIKKKYKTRDVVIKVVTKCGMYRICSAVTTALLQETIDRHNMHESDGPFLNLLGTNITFTNLLAASLQGEERVDCRFTSAFGAVCVTESLALGECRSFVTDTHDTAIGQHTSSLENTLTIKRVMYRNTTPVTSVTSALFDEVMSEERQRASFLFPTRETVDPTEQWKRFAAAADRRARQGYQLNLTPHAANYFMKSDGIPTAVLLTTSVRTSEDSLPSGRRQLVVSSGGILVQPLAHSMKRENDIPPVIDKLQNLFYGLTMCPVPPTISSIALAAMEERNTEEGVLMQDMLSIATGDYAGASAVSKEARVQYQDIDVVRDQYQPYRERYGLGEISSAAGSDCTLELDPTTVTRTPLDFLCRCSSGNMMTSISAINSVVDRKTLIGTTSECRYCAKKYVITKEMISACDGSTSVTG